MSESTALPPVVDAATWRSALEALRAREKAATRDTLPNINTRFNRIFLLVNIIYFVNFRRLWTHRLNRMSQFHG